MQLTQKAQDIVAQYLLPAQMAIDATTGNGHDCCFLAQQVGKEGKVFAFDVQQQALDSTSQRLQQQGLESQVQLILQGHEHLAEAVPQCYHGLIHTVMFNLGYLPHGDKTLTTCTNTTSQALQQANTLLHPHGIICVLAYRGHPGGAEEALAAEQTLKSMCSSSRHLSCFDSPGPRLLLLAPQKHV